MKKVSNILTRKGSSVIAIDGSTTVLDALKLMSEKNIGAVLVIDNDEISGIFTERDYSRKLVLKGKFSKETLVSEVMVHVPLITVNEDEEISNCMNLMTNRLSVIFR